MSRRHPSRRPLRRAWSTPYSPPSRVPVRAWPPAPRPRGACVLQAQRLAHRSRAARNTAMHCRALKRCERPMTGPFEVQLGVSTLLLTACKQRFSLRKGPRNVPHQNPEHILDIVVARYTSAIEPRTRPFSFSSYRPSPSTSPAGDATPNAVGRGDPETVAPKHWNH